jgi:hypothetical protein
MRFEATGSSAGTNVIHSYDVLNLLAVGTAANTVKGILGAVRVKQIEIYSPISEQGAAVTCSIEWESNQASNIEISDTSMSTAKPAHLRSRPPPNSLANNWQNLANGNTPLFNIVAPPASTIDLWFDFTLFDEENSESQISVSTTAAVTTGLLYYLALDCKTDQEAVVFPPVSLTTIA